MEGETVFKSDARSVSDVRMCEKVAHIAHAIYRELEELIRKYDQDVVKGIMPHLVNTLETLDASFRGIQSLEVEAELLREDNEQLLVQYEREKASRRASETKLLEAEDAMEGERVEWRNKVSSLESIAKMLELKYKNASEHGVRLQERETEIQREYNKLYVKYKDLLKTHVDHIEHYKMLFNSDRRDARVNRASGPVSFGFGSLEPAITEMDHSESVPGSPLSASPPALASLGQDVAEEMPQDGESNIHAELPDDPLILNDSEQSRSLMGRSHTQHESRSGNMLYQVLSYSADLDSAMAETEESIDVTGGYVHPGEYASTANDNSNFSMGREVEKLITENQELLTIKNALNIVKDDLIARVDELNGEQDLLRGTIATMQEQRSGLHQKIEDLEGELKLVKESLNQRESNSWGGDDADVPMSQRKRFTRVEMARVLMERNQYKEKLIELQEAVRFRDMIRASRNDPEMLDKKNKGIWKLFSNLFSSSERPPRPKSSPHLRVGPGQGSPLGIRHSRTQADFLETQVASERQARRNTDRRDQFRQVRAHVRKEDGRTQAYGWSLPGKAGSSASVGPNPPSTSVPVPVPVFCRPLAEADPSMKVWCAAGVDRRGGYTRDGGHMVGQSVFYGETSQSGDTSVQSEESQRHSPEVLQIEKELRSTHISNTAEREISSIVWVCSSTPKHCVITVIDANNPAEVLESFTVPEKHLLCIASVPGTIHADYEEIDQRISNMADKTSKTAIDADAAAENKGRDNSLGAVNLIIVAEEKDQQDISSLSTQDISDQEIIQPSDPLDIEVTPVASSPPLDNTSLAEENSVGVVSEGVEEGGDVSSIPHTNEMFTVMATMWIGSQSGMLYIHSAIGKLRTCLAKIKMRDAILSIVHCASRCVVGLANGTVAVFARGPDGCWDFSQYHLVTLGANNVSVRCLAAVGCTVWCGYRNKVYILEPRTLSVIHALEAHPRVESQVRQMAWFGEGVWVSIRLDSTLKLYHAHTYQHLQDVDIEPYVSKMLGTGKLGFSLVRITALLVSSGRLWIGTGNGVIISVPLSEPSGAAGTATVAKTSSPMPGSIVRLAVPITPFCTMASAQLSFPRSSARSEILCSRARATVRSGGHIAIASRFTPTLPVEMPMLVLSGGEGYIDFRIETDVNEESGEGAVWLENENSKKFCSSCNSLVHVPGMVQGETFQPAVTTKCPKCDAAYYRNVSHILMWQS